MSIRAGAVGINLTQANKVFLFEPSLNPALERYARRVWGGRGVRVEC
jgi:SNF2 family DNA or RNA helicase